jgi:hypothetical protein
LPLQTDGDGHGTVVLLKWAANDGTLGTPKAPALDSASQYASCTSSCMVQFNLTDTLGSQVDDETSSIYYDFTNDIAWVGDNIGLLHQFHPFFLGTATNPPAEVRNTLWPATVSASWLSSPVYDAGTGNVFVGDGSGFLHAVNSTTAAGISSGQLDFGTGIIEGPVVDTGNGFVYVFASRDNDANCITHAPCAAVYQLPTAFSSGATGTEVKIGESAKTGTPNPTYLGGFDSSYYNSGTASGNLYVCGSTGSKPQLFQIPIALGVPGTASIVATLAAGTDTCSPVTDVPNPNTSGGASERVFVSVQNDGFYSACASGGCVMNFLNTQWLASTSYSSGQQIMDTKFHIETVVSPLPGTSSITPPNWPGSTGTLTPDGTVIWLDQGPLALDVAAWAAGQIYGLDQRILDSNNNVEIATTAGTSGSGTPTWNSNGAGSLTDDGTVIWTNAGTVGTFALPAAGGTSGIISDNVSTLAGASQIYFTTLGNQNCTTSGTTGGCAVQASQPALQ